MILKVNDTDRAETGLDLKKCLEPLDVSSIVLNHYDILTPTFNKGTVILHTIIPGTR